MCACVQSDEWKIDVGVNNKQHLENKVMLARRSPIVLLALLIALSIVVTHVTCKKLLVFSKTATFRHGTAIDAAVNMFKGFAGRMNYDITYSEDSEAIFGPSQTPQSLADQYDVIVFLHTTGPFLYTETQKSNFKAYIENGNRGFVGIHAASDGMYDWEWYGGKLIGGFFTHHPAIQSAEITIEQPNHPIMKNTVAALDGSTTWIKQDEWYQFDRNPRTNAELTNVQILATVDESTYTGGDMGADHPLIWCHEYSSAAQGNQPTKVFYTALGHPDDSYTSDAYIAHIIAGIEWVSSPTDVPPPAAASSVSQPSPLPSVVVEPTVQLSMIQSTSAEQVEQSAEATTATSKSVAPRLSDIEESDDSSGAYTLSISMQLICGLLFILAYFRM